MKIVIAIDSFKGSLSSSDAANAVSLGIRRSVGDADIAAYQLADGGEGTVDAIVSSTGGTICNVQVEDPLGRTIDASYGIINGNTAVIEMASAAGITLLRDDEKNPLYTSTYGVGQMIIDAITCGCRNFIIGIGGSATNDGGVGMLMALGFTFCDKDGKSIRKGAIGLRDLYSISCENTMPELCECNFCVACDVKNVLCGTNGCSYVFGPQKGATEVMIKDMDMWLMNYAKLSSQVIESSDMNFPGSGAAGGMGFALRTFLGAELKPGIGIVLDAIGIEKDMRDADFVITGEGRLDGQSCMGKAPVGVALLAKKYSVPVIAFSGSVTEDASVLNEYGIDAYFPILRAPCSIEEAMEKNSAFSNLASAAEQTFKLISSVIKR